MTDQPGMRRVLREKLWRPASRVISYAVHVHYWDWCRSYGQYRYRICLNGCGQRLSC